MAGTLVLATACVAVLSACGGSSTLVVTQPSINGIQAGTSHAGQKLGFPSVATKNTTRVGGGDPIADAAGVALAVYPAQGPGTHPATVTIAPTDDWQAALASSVFMAAPLHAPVLLSGSGSLPSATADALATLAPYGSGAAGGAQVIRIGDTPRLKGKRTASIAGSNPYSVTAGIDRLQSAVAGRASPFVVVVSADHPAYAMPAAGWAAESGDPILFVSSSGVPTATRQALLSHQHPRIYVLGPPSVISAHVVAQLRHYGIVNRVGAQGPSANSVTFASYRDPPCVKGQPCAHVPGSFGWAMRSPGHGYVLLNAARTLDAAAAAPLSASGAYGPELLIDSPSKLPSSLLNFFLNYAVPGYAQEGPTAAVYDHGWVIGNTNAVSLAVQSELDYVLEVRPVSTTAKGP
ncbi:MAG: cell wall-binding repeat-containing protein [Solirubrobacterales bacterium]|nr:cell wall-binding repeat-containing protein [Solirubrobacterales bacterium]